MNPNKVSIRDSINDSEDIDKENIQHTIEYNNPNFSSENLLNYEKKIIDKIQSAFTNSYDSIPSGLKIYKKNDELKKKKLPEMHFQILLVK